MMNNDAVAATDDKSPTVHDDYNDCTSQSALAGRYSNSDSLVGAKPSPHEQSQIEAKLHKPGLLLNEL